MGAEDKDLTLDGQEPEGEERDLEQDSKEGEEDGEGVTAEDLRKFRAELTRARNDAAKERKRRQQSERQLTEFKQLVQKGLGGEDNDGKPEDVQKELSALKNSLRRERVHNAFLRVADELEADPELTMAYLEHKGMLNDLDPEEEGYQEDLADKVRAAIKANPKLRASGLSSATGAEFTKGTRGGKKGQDVNDSIRRAAFRRLRGY